MKDKNIGTKYSDFIILKILKREKFGFVAKVKSKKDDKIYAMKRIDLNLLDNQRQVDYYENEYDMLKKFKPNYENVCKPLCLFPKNNVNYLITEYMDCGNLEELFIWNQKNNERIEEKKLVKIFIQCLQGLNYIHKIGIIHRSIKLENIIIDSNSRVKIIDFTKAIEKKENDNKIIDIGVFTAPEMKNKKRYDEKVDVYSLGMVFNLLTYFTDKIPDNCGKYSDVIFINIKKMLAKEMRTSIKEIYLDFKKIYYNLVRASLQCFVSCFKEDLLRFQAIGIADNKLVELAIKLHKNNKNYFEDLNKTAIELEDILYENGFSINDITLKNITNFMFSLASHNNDIFEDTNNKWQITKKCKDCKYESISTENEYFINVKSEKIMNEKGDIKNLFNKSSILDNCYIEICCNCLNNVNMEKSSQYLKLSKYLIIIIEPGIKMSQLNKDNLAKLELEEGEILENKYSYELRSIITSNEELNEHYDYFIGNGGIFKKNEGEKTQKGEDTHKLEDITGNIVALYYIDQYYINNINVKKNEDLTEVSSQNNEQNQNFDNPNNFNANQNNLNMSNQLNQNIFIDNNTNNSFNDNHKFFNNFMNNGNNNLIHINNINNLNDNINLQQNQFNNLNMNNNQNFNNNMNIVNNNNSNFNNDIINDYFSNPNQ